MELVEKLAARLKELDMTLATAESCTGGLIASTLTDMPGSSGWFKGAVVAYANQVKSDVLLVPEAILAQEGAVSEPVVRIMADAVRSLMKTEAAVAVSGIAGPDGGTPAKPVGTVCLGWAVKGQVFSATCHFQGSRLEIKQQTVVAALSGLLALLE